MRLEQARLAEASRLADEAEQARLAEAARLADEAEQARLAEAARLADEAEQARLAEAARLADEAEQARLAEAARLADEAEQARLAEAARLADEAEQARLAEAARLADEAEQARLAEAARLADEAEQARLAEAARLADEAEQARLAEAARLADEAEQARLAEAARLADEAEQARLAEAARLADEAEQARLAEAARLADEAEQARLAEEARLAELQRLAEQTNPTDALGQNIKSLTTQTATAQESQNNLLERLTDAVNTKDEDLRDLKEANDLSEKGIFVTPKPFKSVSQENAEIAAIQSELDQAINAQSDKIAELENLLNQRAKNVSANDATNEYYRKAITDLKLDRELTQAAKADLVASLERIKEATQFERSRRIKKAVFNNEEDRYEQDQASLRVLKANTPRVSTPYTTRDFDFGDQESGITRRFSNVENTDSGYYIVLATHGSAQARDAFVKKVIASGYSDVNYFYNINTSKYYIYIDKVDSIASADEKLSIKNEVPFAEKVSIIQIDN